MRAAADMIQAGDIVLRKYTYYLDSYFIKGEYSHSGIATSEKNVMHAVAEGVCRVDFFDFIKDSDGFMILRPVYKEEQRPQAILKALMLEGKPYDFIFNTKSKNAFYCHELTNYCLRAAGLNVQPEGKIIYASDFIKAFDVAYEADV
jgi:uncharacterized protein YycO